MPSTAILMRAVFLLIFIMLWGQIAVAQTVTQNQQTIFTIEINESGNALWSAEMLKPLTTQSEISEWESALKENTSDSSIMVAELDKINMSLSSAQNYSNRSMSAENFNITYDLSKTLPNAYIKIRFSFEWKNFSRVNSSKILIGDAFSEGGVFSEGGRVPSSNNVLIIKVPVGYHLVNASPNFDKIDGNRLIWDGTLYRSFNKGEPSLELSRDIVEQDSSSNSMLILVLVILFSGGLFILWKKKGSPKHGHTAKTELSQPSGEIQKEKGESFEGGTNNRSETQIESSEKIQEEQDEATLKTLALSPELMREILSDEEMIEKYLVKFGGQAYQSEIVEQSGLSKSKISIVLAKMKEDGRILKIRKGKENIIRIVPKKE
ncbi:MAG: hypothetical protein O8C58_00305 [Candidatus Methanoperedens sp.]|nr:hypothetical protein [Candidatus Methanoperedens sp.]